ncbi:MAG: hypothetical protein U0840_29175 [Gemmataceae bacterium]
MTPWRSCSAGALLLLATAPLLAQTASIQQAVEANLAARRWAAPPLPARESDQLNYLFLSTEGPVFLRLHLRIGNRPYDAAWSDWMDQLFTWFDRDRDGSLSPAEAGRLTHPNSINLLMQGGLDQNPAKIPLARLDRDRDGKVSPAEMRAFYRAAGLVPLQLTFSDAQATAAHQINQAIYQRLGASGDGRLTQKRLARLSTLMQSLDENEDELLSMEELNVGGSPNQFGVVLRSSFRQVPVTLPPGLGLVEITPEMTPAQVVGLVMQRYDRNKDGRLSRPEIGLDEAAFKRLDSDGDGQLTTKELLPLGQGAPDFVLRLRAGAVNPVSGFLSRVGLSSPLMPERIEIVQPQSVGPLPLRRLRRVNRDNVALTLGDTQIQMQASEGTRNVNSGLSYYYLQQFDALADKKGFITRDQDTKNPQQGFLFGLFDSADRDGDGKLTRKELNGYLNLMEEAGKSHVSLTIEDQGRGIFSILDADGNGSLSIREMRSAWERVKPLIKQGDGLKIEHLPRTVRIVAGQGGTFFQPQVFAVAVAQPGPAQNWGSLPVWFRKMDRNYDGDLSPREWLGSEADFRAIDTDGDGLISSREAQLYEMRKAVRR